MQEHFFFEKLKNIVFNVFVYLILLMVKCEPVLFACLYILVDKLQICNA